MLLHRQQYDAAIADFDAALTLDASLVVAQYDKALALDQAGRTTAAIAAYKTFLSQASPEHAAMSTDARERLAAIGK